MKIELIYFDGCPNAEAARTNLLQALSDVGVTADVRIWKQGDPGAPPYVARHGSPTVLVNGRDVTGAPPEADAAACRADGAPSVGTIATALRG